MRVRGIDETSSVTVVGSRSDAATTESLSEPDPHGFDP
jgi:hypothetical protein